MEYCDYCNKYGVSKCSKPAKFALRYGGPYEGHPVFGSDRFVLCAEHNEAEANVGYQRKLINPKLAILT